MFMGDEDTWAARYDQAATDFLGEPAMCVQGTRTRGWSSMALSYVSPAAGMVQMLRGKKKAGGFPQMFLVAVTETKLHVLAMPKMNWKVTEPRATKELAVWDLAGITVATEPVFNGVKVVIEAPAEGEHVEIQVPEGPLGARVIGAMSRQVVAA